MFFGGAPAVFGKMLCGAMMIAVVCIISLRVTHSLRDDTGSYACLHMIQDILFNVFSSAPQIKIKESSASAAIKSRPCASRSITFTENVAVLSDQAHTHALQHTLRTGMSDLIRTIWITGFIAKSHWHSV